MLAPLYKNPGSATPDYWIGVHYDYTRICLVVRRYGVIIINCLHFFLLFILSKDHLSIWDLVVFGTLQLYLWRFKVKTLLFFSHLLSTQNYLELLILKKKIKLLRYYNHAPMVTNLEKVAISSSVQCSLLKIKKKKKY